jgi:hypothetical protein
MKAIPEPIRFLSKNYLNEFCELNYTSDENLNFLPLCDFNPYKENPVISNDTDIEFRIYFKDDYSEYITRKVDTVILQNINLKTFQVKGVVAGTGFKFLLANVLNNTKSDLVLNLERDWNLSAIEISVNEVFPSETDVKLGQLRICKFICDLNATTETEVEPAVSEDSLRTYDGRLTHWVNYEKWGARISARSIKKEQFNLIKNELRNEGYVTIIPWISWDIKDIFQVRIPMKSMGTYALNRWSGLISTSLTVEAQENANN